MTNIIPLPSAVYMYRYSRDLEQARQLGAKKGVSLGFSLGLVYFLIFFVYALSFWFGGYLVSEGRAEPGDVLTVRLPA